MLSKMTSHEIRNVFHVEQAQEAPEFDVVQVRSLTRRSTDGSRGRQIHLSAFGTNMALNLEPNDDLLKNGKKVKLFYADKKNGELQYEEVQDEENPDVGEAYQDLEQEAALLVEHDAVDGSLMVDGTIGNEFVIRPAPEVLKQHMMNGTRAGGDPRDASVPAHAQTQESSGFHVIYKRNFQPPDTDYVFMERDQEPTEDGNFPKSRRKRDAPSVIYPEILIFVDFDGYKLHNADNRIIKKYFVSFWNGVDLRYKLLREPRVKLSVAGIVISKGRDATPYLERNRVGKDAIDSAASLTDMGKYLFVERRLPTYDIAIAITKLDMCRRQSRNNVCNRGTAGFAYVGGACVVNKRLEKVNSVAIIEDTGGFSGIIVAAHELGHLGDTATCLYNFPEEDDTLPRILPGKLLSLDAQCKKDRGTSACFKDERVCSQLFCFDSTSGYCVSYRPAAEGSPCGEGFMCFNGVCVPELDNTVRTDSFHEFNKPSFPANGNFLRQKTTPYVSFPNRHFFGLTVKRSTNSDATAYYNLTGGQPRFTPTPRPAPRTLPKSSERQPTTLSKLVSASAKTAPPLPKTDHRAKKNQMSTISTSSLVISSSKKTSSKVLPNATLSFGTSRVPDGRFPEATTAAAMATRSRAASSTGAASQAPLADEGLLWHPPSLPPDTPPPPPRTASPPSAPTATTLHGAKLAKNDNPSINSVSDDGSECRNERKKIGDLTCEQFLKSYGSKYCFHRYIQKNCCKSFNEFCVNRKS